MKVVAKPIEVAAWIDIKENVNPISWFYSRFRV